MAKYFPPAFTQNVMEQQTQQYLEARRQRARKSVGRGIAGLALGGQKGIDYLDAHAKDNYERDRSRFLEEANMKRGLIQDQASTEQQIRSDNTARWTSAMNAEIQKMNTAANVSMANAQLRARASTQELAYRTQAAGAKLDKMTNGSEPYRDLITQLDAALADQASRLTETLVPGGGGSTSTTISGGPGQASVNLAEHMTPDELHASFLQGQVGIVDKDHRPVNLEDATFSRGRATKTWEATKGISAVAEINSYPEEQRAEALEALGMGQEAYDYFSQYRVDQQEMQGNKQSPALKRALASSGQTPTTTTTKSYRSQLQVQKLTDYLKLPEDAFDSLLLSGELDDDTFNKLGVARANNKAVTLKAMEILGQTGQTPDQAQADRLMLARKMGAELGMAPKDLWEAAAEQGVDLGDFEEQSDLSMRLADDTAKTLYGDIGRTAELLKQREGSGVETQGLDSMMESGAHFSQPGARPRTAEEMPGAQPPEQAAAAPAPPTNPIAQTNQLAAQEQADAQAAEQRQSALQQSGEALFYGMTLPADSIPATSWGQTALLLDMIEKYPDHPPLKQAKVDIMSNPALQEYAAKRGYDDADPNWVFREWVGEFRYRRKRGQANAEKQREQWRKSGATEAREDAEMGTPDTGGAGSGIRRRFSYNRGLNVAAREERRSARKDQREAQGKVRLSERLRKKYSAGKKALPDEDPELTD